MSMIQEAAVRHNARYELIDLRTQFLCAGSDEYIDWVDQLLEIRKTGTTILNLANYSFTLADDPTELEAVVLERLAEGYSARLMAGFCWPWSDPTAEGTLVNDVVIGGFRRPWNAKPDAKRLDKSVPPSMFWATDPKGASQVGCVYTAQGFEFDYAGVIWGSDLVVRDGKWIGQPSASQDRIVRTKSGARFVDVVKNVYRVLLTRAMRGCSVCILDEETKVYVESKLTHAWQYRAAGK